VTKPAVPDAVRLQKNELYKVGRLPSVNCPLPKVKPNSKANVLRFYQALMPCLAQTWEDLVLDADYPFRQPKLALLAKGTTPACGGDLPDTSFYCPNDETIYMRWEDDVKFYKQTPVAVVDLIRTIAHEYGHHVQQLTNILISSDSQAGFAKSKAVELEWSRRLELQASCLGSAFISANQKSLGLVGDNLDFWKVLSKNIGDELTKKKTRIHGSSKNYRFWSDQGFKTANPASCNTYTAPSAKVS
jgi:predicted metalloprotease